MTSPLFSHGGAQRIANFAMGSCLAVMAIAVFINVLLRYGFGSGIAASEELSRLLFVWMVFIASTAAYPRGEHMAFLGLASLLERKPLPLMMLTLAIRALVLVACLLVAWGAWQQVVVGMGSRSVVMGYPVALLALPVLLSSAAIALMALLELVRRVPLDLGNTVEVE